jgi:hypothetical protein
MSFHFITSTSPLVVCSVLFYLMRAQRRIFLVFVVPNVFCVMLQNAIFNHSLRRKTVLGGLLQWTEQTQLQDRAHLKEIN